MFVLYQKERLEGKKTDEAKKEEVPQVSPREFEMAEKVSKYNVNSSTLLC